MIVCLCEGVSDRKINEELGRGVTSWRELERRCGTGRSCGMCRPTIRQMTKQRAARQHSNH